MLDSGRLGLTFAPGKKALGISGQWARDLDTDLERLVRHYGTRVLVSLLAEHEYGAYGISDLPAAAERHQIRFFRLPIPDGGRPPSIDDAMDFVARIKDCLRTEGTVVVRCRGPHRGMLPDDRRSSRGAGDQMVRDVRPSAIENSRQEDFIRESAIA